MIKEKIYDAIADMKTKVGRDSKHIYRDTESGLMYQGVSSVSSIVPKDWLAAWGAKEAVKALGYSDYSDVELALIKWEEIKDCDTVEDYIKILKDAKGASTRKSKKAMVDGTAGHLWLEKLVEARLNGSEVPVIPNKELERPLEQFLKWEVLNVNHWIASECIVVRPDKSYAGQLDAICMLKNGKLALIDFKFASNISEDYFLQCAGYAACFEPYGILFDTRIIIRLPKTLEKDEWKDYQYVKVPNDIEVMDVPTSYEIDRDAFFHALYVKGWINYVTKLNK